MTLRPASRGSLVTRFVGQVLRGLRWTISFAILLFGLASAAQISLVGFLMTLQGAEPVGFGAGRTGLASIAGGRTIFIVAVLVTLALVLDFLAQMAVVQVQRRAGLVVFDIIYDAVAKYGSVSELLQSGLVRRAISQSVLQGVRLGLPLRFFLKALLSSSRVVALVVAAIVVTEIPGVALASIVGGVIALVVALTANALMQLRHDIGAARVEARKSVVRAVESIRQTAETSGEDCASEAVAQARAYVGSFASAGAQRLSILAGAGLTVQVAIALGIATIGLLSPTAGLGALGSTSPAEAAATVLMVVLIVASVGQTVRAGLKFARGLPLFLDIARVHEAIVSLPNPAEVHVRIATVLDQRRVHSEEEDDGS